MMGRLEVPIGLKHSRLQIDFAMVQNVIVCRLTSASFNAVDDVQVDDLRPH
jgi:hypothetical protein